MAIAFELSINFGSNMEAAASFCKKQLPALNVGDQRIELHKPLLSQIKTSRGNSYIEVSVLPVAIGYGVGLDQACERIPLDTEKLSELGVKLY